MATYRYTVPRNGGAMTAATLNEGCTITDFHTDSDSGASAIVDDLL